MNKDKKQDINNAVDESLDFNLDDQFESDNDPILTTKEEIFKIDVRIQEIDVLFERYEDILYSSGEETLNEEEIEHLSEEYKELRKRKKELVKLTRKSIWDKFPIWMSVYAIFQIVFSLFIIIPSFALSSILIKPFPEAPFWLLDLTVPVLNSLISLTILLLLKDKNHKKIFFWIYMIQIVETLLNVIVFIIPVI